MQRIMLKRTKEQKLLNTFLWWENSFSVTKHYYWRLLP